MTNVVLVFAIMVLGGALIALGIRFRTRRGDKEGFDLIDKGFVFALLIAIAAAFAVPWLSK